MLKDETDREIHPDVMPVYQHMLEIGLENNPHPSRVQQLDGSIFVSDHAYINKRKVTCCLYLRQTDKGINEQFEYYTYHYNHHKTLNPIYP